jgi:hypothetical protein
MNRPTSYRSHRRRSRDDKPAFQWQERDTALLEAVWRNRFLTRELLLWLFPPAAPAIADTERHGQRRGTNLDRRLSALYHHGYLDRLRLELGAPLIYALTKRGSERLGELRPDLEPSGKVNHWVRNYDELNRVARPLNVDHAIAIARVRCALDVAARDGFRVDTWQREGTDLKAEWKTRNGRRYVVPDAFLILADERDDPKRYAFFLEIDRSTMKASRMADKFQRYGELYEARMHRTYFNVPNFRVLTVCKSPERAANLRALVRGEFTPPHATKRVPAAVPDKMRSFFYFTDEHTFAADPRNVLAAVWTAAHTDEQQAIVPRPLKVSR